MKNQHPTKAEQSDKEVKELLEKGRPNGEKDFNKLLQKAAEPLRSSDTSQK